MIGEVLAGLALRLITGLLSLAGILCEATMVLRHGPRYWRIQRALRRRAWREGRA